MTQTNYAFCQDTGIFYSFALKEAYEKAGTWPQRYTEVSKEDRDLLCSNLPAGMAFGADANGQPVYVQATPLSLAHQIAFNKTILANRLGALRPVIAHLRELEEEKLISAAQKDKLEKLLEHRRALLMLNVEQAQVDWPVLPLQLLK